ncbi:MFS transporter [Nocardia terpenica]|uniref:MFS transporter n=2 Tax=Nocardia terpenica TaxID=455432 RepID=UPI0018960B82|nr:MFS transporter [Nocardia terpenica]MBF6065158.1 MFS transporter [Nocardia terpenica]MBF6107886.1 MFS transporter [Nocardia terpenica]MBF6115583.1 MFS transporter [Nocardia terpenica]MBF6122021.1 MFS transporter [Nocardia terpenica]MBF6155435.1 MFS transporter [Nocardia terpenica]
MYKRLFPLALATFAVGVDGFVIAGLLPAIAEDLGTTTPAAGQLVTVFAVTFAVASPVLGAATSGLNRRTALILALSIFVVGNAATALGTGYGAVMAARIVTAAGAGIITSAASSTAAAVAPPQRRGAALAFVMGGLTTATALGLPLGTLIGGTDWHLTLWAVAALGLIACLGIAFGMPKVSLPAATLGQRLAPLRQPWVLGVLSVTVLALAGTYVLYVYIGAAFNDVTHGSVPTLTGILFAWGVGTLIGTILAGRLTDRYIPERVLLIGLAATVVVLAVGPWATANLATTIVWAAVWGICVGVPLIPQQHRLVAHAPAASPILLALNSASVYAGVAIGGALGGLAQTWIAPTRLALPAAGLTTVALTLTLITTRRHTAKTTPTREPTTTKA